MAPQLEATWKKYHPAPAQVKVKPVSPVVTPNSRLSRPVTPRPTTPQAIVQPSAQPKPKPTNDPKTEVIATDTVAQNDTISAVQPKEKEAEEVKQPVVKPEETAQPEEPQPAADDPSAQFKKDFWNLVHQRTIQMDPYDLLYKENKATASGEEYDYLRFEVLKDTPHFKEWSTKLRKIPSSELESINTVNDLKNKLKEI
jgi:hypothetical protein